MYTLYKVFRNLVRAMASSAAPWQIATGTLLGTLLGFLPICPLHYGPAPLGLGLLLLALIINCHVASLVVFFGVGKLLAVALSPLEVSLGNGLSDYAERCADIPLFYLSLWSHTGYLGRTIIGALLAVLFAGLMTFSTHYLRTRLLTRLQQNRHLLLAGKTANHPWAVRIGCWFFGL